MRPETAKRIVRNAAWNLYSKKQIPRSTGRVLAAIERVYSHNFRDKELYPNPLQFWIEETKKDMPIMEPNTLMYYSDRILAPHRLGWFYYHLQSGNFNGKLGE